MSLCLVVPDSGFDLGSGPETGMESAEKCSTLVPGLGIIPFSPPQSSVLSIPQFFGLAPHPLNP